MEKITDNSLTVNIVCKLLDKIIDMLYIYQGLSGVITKHKIA